MRRSTAVCVSSACLASMLGLIAVGSCRPAAPRDAAGEPAAGLGMAAVRPTPLVLALHEGERRVRRFAVSAPRFTIKVDRQNGGSPDLVMGYEDLPPGGSIPPHRHRVADEIIFVHRGSGVVRLGDQETAFGTGATIYIPKDVRVTLRNTGADPLSIAFFFNKPGFEGYLRDISVPEGQPVILLSDAALAAIRRRHGSHTAFEQPQAQP